MGKIIILSIIVISILNIKIAILFLIFNTPFFFRLSRDAHRLLAMVYALILDVLFVTIFFSLFSLILLFLFNKEKIKFWLLFPCISLIIGVSLDMEINKCIQHRDKLEITLNNQLNMCNFLLKHGYIEKIKLNNQYIYRPNGVFYNYLQYE